MKVDEMMFRLTDESGNGVFASHANICIAGDKDMPKLQGYEIFYTNENVVVGAKTFDDYDHFMESNWQKAEQNAAYAIYRELLRHGTTWVKSFIKQKYGVQEDKIFMEDD